MTIKKGEWFLLLFNLTYVISFTIYYISIKNFEFLWYIAIMLFFLAVIALTIKKTKFTYPILWGLSIWGLLHMVGGGVKYMGGVVYGLELIPIWVTENFYVLQYDQFVHAYLYFIVVFVIWHLLKTNLKNKPNFIILYPVILLSSIGIGALNEIAEFMPVLLLKNTGVGGYYNTAWDLVSNTIGALLGIIILHFKLKKKKS